MEYNKDREENSRWNNNEEVTDRSTIGRENPDTDRGEEYKARLQVALEARDPSLAKPVYDDPKLNWLCRECPYQVNCKRMQNAVAAA
jgi:hypothetical protein